MKKRLSVFFLIVLLLIGAGSFTFSALKIEIKGKLAQVLLQRAWEKSLIAGNTLYRPWPSFDGTPILRLDIPKHKISQIIVRGTSGQTLAFAPGLHIESFLPYENKITIISSHKDSHGSYIRKLKLGDIIKIQDQYNNWHSYIIDELLILNVNEEQLSTDIGQQRLLLVTCYPFNALRSGTPYRYIVSAKKYLI